MWGLGWVSERKGACGLMADHRRRLLPLLLVLAAAPVQGQTDAGTVVISLGVLLLVASIGFVCCCCGPIGAWLVCFGGLKHIDYRPDEHLDTLKEDGTRA